MKVTSLLGAGLLAVFAVSAGAAPQPNTPRMLRQYVHNVWQRNNGLPQDSVNAVLQTRDGYLWLGTQEGLARFDGVRFTPFNKSNTPAFTHNDVSGLAEGPDGTLWIGTYGGLVEMKDGRFVAHPTGRGRASDSVMSIAVDRHGVVWCGTQHAGLNRYDHGRYQFFTAENGLASDVVNDIAFDAAGDVWIATDAGLSVLRAGTWRSLSRSSGLPGSVVWQVHPTSQDGVWVGTDHGVVRVVGDAVHPVAQPRELAAAAIRSLLEDRDGALWIGTEAGLVWRVAGDSVSSLELANSVSGNYVLSMVQDREGSVWVGTYASGLHHLWRGRFSSLTRLQGLPDDDVRTIRQMHDGSVWIATEAAGVARYDGTSMRTFTTANGLPHNTARSFFEDSKGTLWIGTRSGLCRFDGNACIPVPETRGLSIRAVGEDSAGTLWVGVSTDGVRRLVGGALVRTGEDGKTPLPRGVLRTIVRDHAGTMWVGTNEGLTRWDHGSPTLFTSKDGLPRDPIYCIHEDAQHTLWIGSYGGGLVRFKNGTFTRFTQADGLFDDVVYEILEDDSGNLWISCNNGVYSVAKAQLDAFAERKLTRLTTTAYDNADGMLSVECNGNSDPSGWRTTDGRLWFPTVRGVTIIDPTDLQRNSLPPPVAIEAVTINGRRYSPGEAVVAPPGAGRLEFEYTGLSFIAPQRVRFRHRLEPFDVEWTEATGRRETNYTNLAPGKYVFRVVARNDADVWNTVGASFAFELQPHFYQAWWFRALALFGMGALIAGGVRLRVWHHVRRERELARRVELALGRIKVLGGLIPICANCKKIRDDRGYWNHLEQYLRTHSEATFSHGICPDCMTTLYPDWREESVTPDPASNTSDTHAASTRQTG